MSWFGRMIGLITLDGTTYDPKKSKRRALAERWFSEPSAPENARCIMSWDKLRLAVTSSAS
jgi:hypothetical protein